jgi:putative transposase
MRAYRTEIKPTIDQISKIRRTIGTCRFIYNFYLAHNREAHENGGKFVSANDFSKWLNNEYIPSNPEKAWIKEVSSKSVKQSVVNAQTAYKRFFDKLGGFPKFKKRRNQDVKMYFVKTDAKTRIKCERHRIKIPTLGWVRLKEYGYLPQAAIIKSGTVSEKAGRYYITVLVDADGVVDTSSQPNLQKKGIGVDLGIKNFAVVSNGKVFDNINRKPKIKKLEERLRREQRSLSRKYENKKSRKEKLTEHSANIEKNILRIQKIHQALQRKRQEYARYVVSNLVKTKPKYITIENLNISGMMKNRHLSKAIAKQNLYYFRNWLIYQCGKQGIEVRVADRFYPSSKMCCQCGHINKELELKDRTYICHCGNNIDRDLQASINLERCCDYKVA